MSFTVFFTKCILSFVFFNINFIIFIPFFPPISFSWDYQITFHLLLLSWHNFPEFLCFWSVIFFNKHNEFIKTFEFLAKYLAVNYIHVYVYNIYIWQYVYIFFSNFSSVANLLLSSSSFHCLVCISDVVSDTVFKFIIEWVAFLKTIHR